MSIPHPLRIDDREDALKLSVFKDQFLRAAIGRQNLSWRG